MAEKESIGVFIKFSKSLLERFDSVVESKGLGRSEVLRHLVLEYVEKQETPSKAKEASAK